MEHVLDADTTGGTESWVWWLCMLCSIRGRMEVRCLQR